MADRAGGLHIGDPVRARPGGPWWLPIARRLEAEMPKDLDGKKAVVKYTQNGQHHELEADYIAGCDGFHGVCRAAVPGKTFEKAYPFAWLGILAQVAPSCHELIYARHPNGFALHTMRSPTLTRLYLQCPLTDTVNDWPDDRVWKELGTRLNMAYWKLEEGPVVDKGITEMRSFFHEPMQRGRLFLAGEQETLHLAHVAVAGPGQREQHQRGGPGTPAT